MANWQSLRCTRAVEESWRAVPSRTYEAGMNERVTLVEFDSLEQAISARESAAYLAAFAKLGGVVRDVRVIEGS